MATVIDPGDEVFLDTSYALALSAPTDEFHARALRLADELEAAKARLVTTRAVLLEIGNALSRQRYRVSAVRLLEALEADPDVEVVGLSDDLFARAFELYAARADKEWGLIDCVSFVVMTERGHTKALTADEHFLQCGFRALLREAGG
jgi:predicted nucleic acid-binding protein